MPCRKRFLTVVTVVARNPRPGDLPARDADVMGFKGIENRDDYYVVGEGDNLRIRDSLGVYVVWHLRARGFVAL